MDLLYIVTDAVECSGEQEQIGELGVDFGDDLVVRQHKEYVDLIEGGD